MRCGHVTKAGTPCQANATPSGFCFYHDPNRKQERKAASVKGGMRSRKPSVLPPHDAAKLQSVADVLTLLRETIDDVRQGMDSKTANCLAYLASVGLRAITGEKFEERLAALEAQAAQRRTA
jgi:hypothetical protein